MISQQQAIQLMNENQALKAELTLFQARCEQYSQAYDSLKEQIREMQRHRFGQRSERYIDPAQTQLDLLQDNIAIFANAEASGEQLPEENTQVAAHTRKKKNKTEKIVLRDVNPKFVVMELLDFFQEKKVVRPGHTTLQTIVRDALNTERKRLGNLMDMALKENEKVALRQLLLEEETLSGLAVLKQDAKDFKARMMTTERDKLEMIKPIFLIAKTLLPCLNLSKQNIHYYASLINYYSIHELRTKLTSSHRIKR